MKVPVKRQLFLVQIKAVFPYKKYNGTSGYWTHSSDFELGNYFGYLYVLNLRYKNRYFLFQFRQKNTVNIKYENSCNTTKVLVNMKQKFL